MLTLETVVAVPNAVYAPMIMFQTGINNGKPITSCQITLAAIKVTNAGTKDEAWEQTGKTEMIHIADLNNLSSDIAKVGSQVVALLEGVTDFIAEVNSTRKVL
jgi:hypothetical protein